MTTADPVLAAIDKAIAEVKEERRQRRVSVWLLSLSVLFTMFLGGALWQNAQQDADRDNQAEIDAAFVACERGNEIREVSRFLVLEATQPGAGLDLTKVPGFDDLDPEMQRFLRSLRDLSAQSGTSSLRDRTLPKLQPRNCDAEFPRHS